MSVEIERKFLLKNSSWREHCLTGKQYLQGYMTGSDLASVRVRLEDNDAYINIKSLTLGIIRDEYEYSIPKSDAIEMLDNLCVKPLIKKKRYIVIAKNKNWEIDVFEGDNAGLVVAEIELDAIDEDFELPDFIAQEVTDDKRYYNVNLVNHPFNKW